MAVALALICAAVAGCGGSSGSTSKTTPLPALAPGRVGPESMFTIASQLTENPTATLNELKRLGVDRVHVYLPWGSIAPDPQSETRPAFDATDPAAYPATGWAVYDQIVRGLAARHIGIDLALTGPPPVWAEARGGPKYDYNENDYKPDPAAYQQWVQAVGMRYSGTYTPTGQSTPLPRVNFWSIWNEPNLGTFLAPETAHGGAAVEIAPRLYRGLVDGAWKALHATGHGDDTILIGELAPIGNPGVGVFNVMAPLRFLRALYCVDANLRQLRGTAAAARGCPTTASASATFAADHPGAVPRLRVRRPPVPVRPATGQGLTRRRRRHRPGADPEPRVTAGPGQPHLRLLDTIPDLVDRVRLRNQPAECPHGSDEDRGAVSQLGRVPHLVRPADQVL